MDLVVMIFWGSMRLKDFKLLSCHTLSVFGDMHANLKNMESILLHLLEERVRSGTSRGPLSSIKRS